MAEYRQRTASPSSLTRRPPSRTGTGTGTENGNGTAVDRSIMNNNDGNQENLINNRNIDQSDMNTFKTIAGTTTTTNIKPTKLKLPDFDPSSLMAHHPDSSGENTPLLHEEHQQHLHKKQQEQQQGEDLLNIPVPSPSFYSNLNPSEQSIHISRPSTPSLRQRSYLSVPSILNEIETEENDQQDIAESGGSPSERRLVHDDLCEPSSFFAHPRGKPFARPTIRSRIRLKLSQAISDIYSAAFLIPIVIWALTAALYRRIRHGKSYKDYQRSWDHPHLWKNEKHVKELNYYAESCGFKIIDQTIKTADGYFLRVHRVFNQKQYEYYLAKKDHNDFNPADYDQVCGLPVLIQHGLFQTSGSFVTSEDRSLAFWLAGKGYQVYLANNRGVFDMGHETLKRSDPRFWDFNIRELALYDLPAAVQHVRHETGYDKIAFIGHSQGNATMFCSLARGLIPSLGSKLSVFIALAPAVYAGPLTTGFPFSILKAMDWNTWHRVFGVLDFIPLMRKAYDYVPGSPFAFVGYQLFAFLFNWTDANWLCRRKTKMFRFTPSPVSSAGIFWWTGLNGFSTRGCVLDPKVVPWFDERFPPLSLYSGGRDYLVLIDPLIERLSSLESTVKVIRHLNIEKNEHCDTFWSVDAVEECFEHILEDLEKTKPKNNKLDLFN